MHNGAGEFRIAVEMTETITIHKPQLCYRPHPLLDHDLFYVTRWYVAYDAWESGCNHVSLVVGVHLCVWTHYSGDIRSAMVSPITSLTIVYSIIFSGADQRKHQSSAVTGEFHAQRASNAENVSIWWRHHEQGLYKNVLLVIEVDMQWFHFRNVADRGRFVSNYFSVDWFKSSIVLYRLIIKMTSSFDSK